MKIEDIAKLSEAPKLYEKGSAFMWTDPYISKQLLQIHLNPDIDVASRKKATIERTINWILEDQTDGKALNILDLGCGPGLYTELFAKNGHKVTGIDISQNSIAYASQSAKENGLAIDYKNVSYLDADLGEEQYDLIVMIYTDMGVLSPIEREQLLANCYRALKKGGVFIFDVLKDKDFKDKLSPKSWESSEKGFWRGTPYLALSESFLYEQEKVILSQHIIINEKEGIETYRFWTHFFSEDDLAKLLEQHHFQNIEFLDDILPESDMWNGDNVIFTKCVK